jgi:hypothetical protein
MAWDGIEKRVNREQRGFCPAHIELISDMAVIKTSLINIEKTITESVTFRHGIMISIFGIAVAVVVQIVSFSYLYGQLSNQVKVNTGRLEVIEKVVNAYHNNK